MLAKPPFLPIVLTLALLTCVAAIGQDLFSPRVFFAVSPEPLMGEWSLTLRLEHENQFAPAPLSRSLSGKITFHDTIPDPWGQGPYRRSPWMSAFGESRIDLTPFFGARVAPDASYTIFGPVDRGFLDESIGALRYPDSVYIELIPRISHGGLRLSGQFTENVIVGEWIQNAYCCGATGFFSMTRLP